MTDTAVQFRSDGLGLSPAAYARLLAEIAETRGIAIDDYSRGGVVAELETRMAELLGKEAAVFLPTGTLANHLAVRLLARTRRRVLVQQESHLWNDEGDCAQTLSGLTLVPLAPGRATITLAEVEAAVAGAPEMRVAAPVGAISIETPVRRVAGQAFEALEGDALVQHERQHKQAGHTKTDRSDVPRREARSKAEAGHDHPSGPDTNSRTRLWQSLSGPIYAMSC